MPKKRGGSGEKPPGHREPAPTEIRPAPPRVSGGVEKKHERSIVDTFSNNMNGVAVVWAFLLTLVASEVGPKKDPQPASPPPVGKQDSVIASPQRVRSEGDALLIAGLNDALRRLLAVMNGTGEGKIARIRDARTPIKEKCQIAGSIAIDHMQDIVKVVTFLQLSPALIQDAELRTKIEEDMQKANIHADDFINDPTLLDALNQGRIEKTKAYAAVTSCGFFVLTFLGGILESGINKNMGLAEPIVKSVIQGVEEEKRYAKEAAAALLNMSKSLLP